MIAPEPGSEVAVQENPRVPGKSLVPIHVDTGPLRKSTVTLPELHVRIRARHLPMILMSVLVAAGASAYPAVSGSAHPILGGIFHGAIALLFPVLVFSGATLISRAAGESLSDSDETALIVLFLAILAALVTSGVTTGPGALYGLGITGGLSDSAAAAGTFASIAAAIASALYGAIDTAGVSPAESQNDQEVDL